MTEQQQPHKSPAAPPLSPPGGRPAATTLIIGTVNLDGRIVKAIPVERPSNDDPLSFW